MTQAMTLSDDQQQALEQGQAVYLTIPENRLDCVLIRCDQFNRLKASVPDFEPETAYAAADEVFAEDWDTPQMAEYDDYDAHRP